MKDLFYRKSEDFFSPIWPLFWSFLLAFVSFLTPLAHFQRPKSSQVELLLPKFQRLKQPGNSPYPWRSGR